MQSAKLASNLLYAVIVKVAICQADFQTEKSWNLEGKIAR
jgi:hypothetical protein